MSESENADVIRCICGYSYDDGNTIACDECSGLCFIVIKFNSSVAAFDMCWDPKGQTAAALLLRPVQATLIRCSSKTVIHLLTGSVHVSCRRSNTNASTPLSRSTSTLTATYTPPLTIPARSRTSSSSGLTTPSPFQKPYRNKKETTSSQLPSQPLLLSSLDT